MPGRGGAEGSVGGDPGRPVPGGPPPPGQRHVLLPQELPPAAAAEQQPQAELPQQLPGAVGGPAHRPHLLLTRPQHQGSPRHEEVRWIIFKRILIVALSAMDIVQKGFLLGLSLGFLSTFKLNF